MSTRDDPQQPSTSMASERRREENLKNFNRLMTLRKQHTTLLYVCTAKTRGRLLNSCRPEVRKLRGIIFPVLLKPHQKYLDDLSKMCGSTFAALCEDLRFLATFKTLPPSMSDSEHEIILFKLVANCVVFENNQWEVCINRETLFDVVTANNLKRLSLRDEKPKKRILLEKPKTEPDPDLLRRNPKRGIPPLPTIRIPERKRLKRAEKPVPDPYQAQRYPDFSPLIDEHMCTKHALNSVNELDSAFCAQSNELKLRINRNNVSVRTKERELTDAEYYSDDVILLPHHISFRLDHVAQITDFPLPLVEDDGYFPADRTDRTWYLWEKYRECNEDCHTLFKRLRQPDGNPIPAGFTKAEPRAQELLHFHNSGLHIHGFFDVWQENERGWKDAEGQWISRRYLVDMYNHFMFPLYIEVEDWCEKMRMTFDKISFYNLKLMTVVRNHQDELRNAGDLFTPYPSLLDKSLPNIQSAKVRNSYLHQIQVENARVIDLKSILEVKLVVNGSVEEEVKKKVRRSRKSDPHDPSAPRAPSTKGRNKSASAAARAHLQKENVDKMLLSPPSTSSIGEPAPVTPMKRKSIDKPPSATKRRHDDNPSPVPPPPIKKPMLVDSWDEHTHRAVAEEHVNEEDDEGPPVAVMMSQTEVWKPREEEGVSPEEYASKILAHYGVKKGEDSEPADPVNDSSLDPPPLPPAPPPPPSSSSVLPPGPLADLVADMPGDQIQGPPSLPPPAPVVKQRRSRKKTSMEGQPPLEQQELQQPSTSTGPPPEELALPNGLLTTPKPIVNGANGTNGSQKSNRTYSVKSSPTITQNKAVFPVKKLGPPLNGLTPVAPSILAPLVPPLAVRMNRRPGQPEPLVMHPHQPGSIGFSKEVMAMAAAVGQLQVPIRTPYFQTGMRPKLPPPGYEGSPSSTIPSSVRQLARIPVQQPRIIQPVPPPSSSLPHRQAFDAITPASRAINHMRQVDVDPESSICRRAMSYNDQMAYKNQHWEPKKKASSMPPNIRNLTSLEVEPALSTHTVVAPPILPYRPRSHSNNGILTRPRPMLAVPPVPETSVGDPNPRQRVPWIGSSRVRSTSASRAPGLDSATSSAVAAVPLETSGPLLPASMTATNVPRTTTTAYTVMDSSNPANQLLPPTASTPASTRTYTNYSRKAHTFTPEQLGLAVRTGSARFQDQQNGDGPTVKTFLMNLNQQLK